MKNTLTSSSPWVAAPASLFALAVVAGCGGPGQTGSPDGGGTSANTSGEPSERETHEAAGTSPRLAVTYDGSGEVHLFDPANLSADSPIDTTRATTTDHRRRHCSACRGKGLGTVSRNLDSHL